MKKLSYLIVCSFLFIECTFYAPNQAIALIDPPLRIYSKFYNIQNQDQYFISPYMINLMAISLVENGNLDGIKDYIKWYLDHLNYPDSYGLTGTMYDYIITNGGVETSTYSYDSADSYAATFLYLTAQYWKATGDLKFIKQNLKKFKDVAYVIAYLQDRDGLVRAVPWLNTKYLMDNSEAFGGLMAFSDLLSILSDKDAYYYGAISSSIKNAINNELYNPGLENFYWAKDDSILFTSVWQIFYPDAFAQLFPIYYHIATCEKQQSLWQKFVSNYNIYKPYMSLEQTLVYDLTKENICQ